MSQGEGSTHLLMGATRARSALGADITFTSTRYSAHECVSNDLHIAALRELEGHVHIPRQLVQSTACKQIDTASGMGTSSPSQ